MAKKTSLFSPLPTSFGKAATRSTDKAKFATNGKKKKAAAPVAPTMPGTYQPGTYQSQYGQQLQDSMGRLMNWQYDPMQDASYQALAKIYGARGNRAAQDTLADAAMLNGGQQTSYAVSAAQQARNQYNQELMGLIPDLEARAYDRAAANYDLLRGADSDAYGRWRDAEADRQWAYQNQYQAARDAMSDYQWKLNYDLDLRQYEDQLAAQRAAQKGSGGGGGGGGGRRRSGGGGYGGSGSGSGYTGASGSDPYKLAQGVATATDMVSGALKQLATPPTSSNTKKKRALPRR
jgi:hypothetical protein